LRVRLTVRKLAETTALVWRSNIDALRWTCSTFESEFLSGKWPPTELIDVSSGWGKIASESSIINGISVDFNRVLPIRFQKLQTLKTGFTSVSSISSATDGSTAVVSAGDGSTVVTKVTWSRAESWLLLDKNCGYC